MPTLRALAVFATGLAFQMPIVILALVRLRVLTAANVAPQPPHRIVACSSGSRR